MSTGQLTNRGDLTKGYLAKFDNSEKAPSFSTLMKIANPLNVEISLLMAESSESPEVMSPCIVRKNGRKEVGSFGGVLYGHRQKHWVTRRLGRILSRLSLLQIFVKGLSPPMKGKNLCMSLKEHMDLPMTMKNMY